MCKVLVRVLFALLLLGTVNHAGADDTPANSGPAQDNAAPPRAPADQPAAEEGSNNSTQSAQSTEQSQDQSSGGQESTPPDAPPPSAEVITTMPSNELHPATNSGRTEIVNEPKTAAEGGATELDEIVVTATRRVQNVLKIPVAVTEVDGARLEAGTIRDMRSLQMEIPSLNIAVSGSDYSGANIRMRGVGTAGSNAGFEGSVGVFMDGVYIPRPGLALADLVDIDRIEVLRGPQGTLFGKNTSVGALSIYTKKPTDQAEAELGATIGSFGSKIGHVILSGPVFGDAVGLRLAAQYNVDDGFVHNLTDGKGYNNKNRYLVRGQALFQPTDFSTLRIIADTTRKDERCCATPYTKNGPGPSQKIRDQGGTVFEPPAHYTVAFDAKTLSFVEDSGIAAILEGDLGWADLHGLVSYRKSQAREPSDADKNDLDLIVVPFMDSSAKPISAELSLHGEHDWLDWVAGAFVSKESIGFSQSILLGKDAAQFIAGNASAATVYPAGSGQTLTSAHQSGQSWSVFSHNIVQLPAEFEFTLGLRYLNEAKEGGGFSDSNSPSCKIQPGVNSTTNSLRTLCAAPPYQASYDDRRITGTGALGKTFSGGQYLYASYSSGFKAGGINLNPPSTIGGTYTFKPETVKAYELGLKMPLFVRTLQLRTALFKMNFKDFQINSYDGTVFTVSNAGAVDSRGVELETTYTGIDYVKLRAAYTFSDTIYGEETQDAALRGKQLTNAPKHAGQFGIDFQHPIWDSTDLYANVVARYQSAVNTGADLNENKVQKGYPLLNARFGLRLPHDFEVSLWGANLTNQFYNQVIFNAPGQPGSFNGSVGPPRTIGLDLRMRF